MFKSDKLLEKLDKHTDIFYQEYKAVFPTSARDFVNIQSVVEREDGTIINFGWTVEHPAMPPRKGFVRADAIIGGFKIVPVPGNPGKCVINYLTWVDLKGSLPTMIVNMVATEQPLVVPKIIALARALPDQKRFLVSASGSLPPTPGPVSPSVAKTMTFEEEADTLGPLASKLAYNDAKVRDACVPSGNAFATACALAKLATAIGGGSDIISKELAQSIAKTYATEHRAGLGDAKWGLGVRTFSATGADGAERDGLVGFVSSAGPLVFYDAVTSTAVAVTVNDVSSNEVAKDLASAVAAATGIGALVDLE